MRCVQPFINSTGTPCPCGRCVPCRKRHASTWSMRLQYHAKDAHTSFFLTLTYSPESMQNETQEGKVITRRIDNNGMMTLNKRDWQLFAKRIRKAQEKTHPDWKMSYYMVGEYGTKKKRPHYHAIIFNVSLQTLISDEKELKRVEYHKMGLDGKTNYICKHWPHGHISIGHVTPASIGYCLIYISERTRIPAFKGDERLPEFSLMSKGLGAAYVDNMYEWHYMDITRQYCTLPDGKKVAMPRYYKDRIYTLDERQAYNNIVAEKELERMFNLRDEQHRKNREIRDGQRQMYGKTRNGRRKQSSNE